MTKAQRAAYLAVWYHLGVVAGELWQLQRATERLTAEVAQMRAEGAATEDPGQRGPSDRMAADGFSN